MKQRWWLWAVGLCLWPAAAAAATDSTTADSVDAIDGRPAGALMVGSWWIGVWGGGALHSKFHTRLGIRYRDFYMAGIRLGRELPVSRQLAVDYFVDVVPLLVSTNNPVEYRTVRTCRSPVDCDAHVVMETATARGYALTPVGVQLRVLPGSRVQPVLGLSLGAAWYDEPVPDPGEKRLNFMGELFVGAQVRAGRSALLAGIRHNHTSNANTGRVNPGLDSRVLYFGVTRPFGGRPRS